MAINLLNLTNKVKQKSENISLKTTKCTVKEGNITVNKCHHGNKSAYFTEKC